MPCGAQAVAVIEKRAFHDRPLPKECEVFGAAQWDHLVERRHVRPRARLQVVHQAERLAQE